MPGVTLPDAVRELAERLGGGTGGPDAADGTLPAYVYDLAGLDRHLSGITAALPGIELFYAVKANPDAMLLRTMAAHVHGFEVSSGGELRHTRVAVPGCRVAFSGPGKTDAELTTAVAAYGAVSGAVSGAGRGTLVVHVESPYELRRLIAVAEAEDRTLDVLLRANLALRGPAETNRRQGTGSDGLGSAGLGSAGPGSAGLGSAGLGSDRLGSARLKTDGPPGRAGRETLVMGGRATPFGMSPESLDEAAALLSRHRRIRLRGLHAHLASGLDARELLDVSAEVAAFARDWCAHRGIAEPEINFGGGMAVDYRHPDSRFDWTAYGRGLAELTGTGATARIEAGRALVAYCGWYVTRVIDVKRSHGEAFAVVAGGTHHLRTPAAKGHDQPFAVVPVESRRRRRNRPGVEGEPVTLVGQLCTPKDVLARGVAVARLRADDLVAFGLAGAYAWNISHHDFLMQPPPAFHHLGGRTPSGDASEAGLTGWLRAEPDGRRVR